MPDGEFEVATGRIVQPTRDEADFASHIERTVATDPSASWIFVADNLTTHGSATLVLLIAGLRPADGGAGEEREKRRAGITCRSTPRG